MQTEQLLQASFEKEMKKSGMRVTHVRQNIFDILKESEHPLSIQDLVSKSEDAHFVSIYRSVDALQKAGVIKQVPRGFKNLFELSDTYQPHHHHATCEKCGKSTSIHDARLENLMAQLSAKEGLKPTKHTFELFGVCRSCQAYPNS